MNRNRKKNKNKGQKPLKELTIKDNFMFGATMVKPENCKGLLEMTLQIPIARVEINIEKTMIYNPEYKGVRLDVYAKDEKNTHYNVEMQAVRKLALGKCSRYYHSQIDMEMLDRGHDYEELPNSYVIFICDFDPFNQRKYCYTFKSICKETDETDLEDGRVTIFLSTEGENEDEVPIEMVKFLKFVKADLATCMDDFEDDFVSKLQKTMQEIKVSREMEGRYMSMALWLHDERKEGKEEGKLEERASALLDVLEEKGEVSEELEEKIFAEESMEVLRNWFKLAVKVSSVEEFVTLM
ncbi:MAG: Rpn family recombination-promoting nuclease/putative transposase [Ruminococcus sp.]|nr:Rpn family recombination-promoting nuclease/putative transposase [Ruminococcus sp.]